MVKNLAFGDDSLLAELEGEDDSLLSELEGGDESLLSVLILVPDYYKISVQCVYYLIFYLS